MVYAKALKCFNNKYFILFVWLCLAIFSTVKQYKSGYEPNNYRIFIYTFFHSLEKLNLYARYIEYGDMNHYGPFFSLIIAPFALMPRYLGIFLWQVANTLFLYYAVSTLPLKSTKINAIYWIIANELLTALFSFQINPSITAIIILSYTMIDRKNNFIAAFLIMLGTFIKLYGIVGLAFFFFVKQKPKFIAYCIFWAIVFFVLPMVFFGFDYIIQCYKDWYISLSAKQLENATLTSWQDMSIMGMARRLFQNPAISNLPFLIFGLILFGLPYLRIKQYKAEGFRLMLLASTLIFTVIFSNSSESPTYIIAFTGVALWFVLQDKPVKKEVIALLIFAFLLTSLAPTDFYPRYIRNNYIMRYSLKALPCILIWFYITYQMLTKNFLIKSSEA
ncbi:glycosyltransferase family 87 protein [Pedobacter nototheniae]|uniref:glycosyltransferase family 87 protein n=1 Tax=Pedobacter nototheniae TaxID=2488994 RepID=UPI00292DCC4F|nr:glycosyltransferase family 87 protein [Pedobacter nototheniae]